MDDDRLARAREGDLDAFLDLVRPRASRLVRLAAIAGGDPAAAGGATSAAIRAAWRDVHRIRDLFDLDARIEGALAARLSRRRPVGTADRNGAGSPLDTALARLRPPDRVALARCLDPVPDPAALAVAGRVGVEIDRGGTLPTGGGTDLAGALAADIVDLDGPLAGWNLPRLRGALEAAAGQPDPDRLVDGLRVALVGTRPEAGPRAALRAILPARAAGARLAGLAVAAVLGLGLVAWSTASPGSSTAPRGPTGGAPDTAASQRPFAAVNTTDHRTAAGPDAGSPVEFPAAIDGYPVIPVETALRLAGEAGVAGRDLAVRGWMPGLFLRGLCAKPDVPAGARFVSDPLAAEAAFCPREAVLLGRPGDTPAYVAHLHPQFLPGTDLGDATPALYEAGGSQLAVVLLVHFGDQRLDRCAPGDPRCGEEVAVDRILWVAGQEIGTAAAVHPITADPAPRRTPAAVRTLVEETFSGARVTSLTGAPAADVGRIEPAAADAVRGTDFAWLVRVTIDGATASDPPGAAMAWLVVDDATGVVTASPHLRARAPAGPAGGVTFPGSVDGAPVLTVDAVLAMARDGLPAGSTMAVAGWLDASILVLACSPDLHGFAWPEGAGPAFCWRAGVLRGLLGGGRAIYLQLPSGTPVVAAEDAGAARDLPIPVVALVQAGSPQAEACWPTTAWCGHELALERLLWVAGRATSVPVAQLDAPGGARPRLTATKVRALAEAAVGTPDRGQLVSIARVPAVDRDRVATGAGRIPVTGLYAWIVRIRSPGPTLGGRAGQPLDRLWWLVIDDATGRVTTGDRPVARTNAGG